MKSRRKLFDITIPGIIEDLDNDIFNVIVPSELCEMLKELGINLRHIHKIAANSQQDHI